jgi:hypothetical protein
MPASFKHIFFGIVQLSSFLALSLAAQEKEDLGASDPSHQHAEITIVTHFIEQCGFSADDLPLLDLSETTCLSEEQISKTAQLTDNPKWAQGDREKVNEYYSLHQEGRLDRLLGYIASRMGVIVHGDVNQEQLALNYWHMSSFRRALSLANFRMLN